MHGMIFSELHEFSDEALPPGAWDEMMREAGIPHAFYARQATYPDAELTALVAAASKLAQRPASAILESFGEFIAPRLLAGYPQVVDPAWRTLEVIENTEAVIHTVVRATTPWAQPPVLRVQRKSPTELTIHYGSQRRLCFLAKGIARGIARSFGEQIEMVETACMHHGAPGCVIEVRLQ